ncbi:MAG: 23S rRNA (guanosine(2251)-2'-O)-methyltransferase RlmB [Anaerolineales bacterium]|jgi:23S rRNA (guanosine2251-2'-O)-methyltransferase
MNAGRNEVIYGRNPVLEVLKARRRHVEALQLAQGAEVRGTLADLIDLAQAHSIPVENIGRDELDQLGVNHQGIAAVVSPYPYAELAAILERAGDADPHALVLLLDALQDPQNLGTLLRTAEAVNVCGVIMPGHRSASVTPAVVRASAGASEHLLIAQYNLVQAMDALKENGFWIAGLERVPEARPLADAPLGGNLAIVVGSEGSGMRRLVRESCDFLVGIPMYGRIESLNAAVAGSLVLYAARERQGSNHIDATPESW